MSLRRVLLLLPHLTFQARPGGEAVILGDAAALRPQLESAGFQVEVLERAATSTLEHQNGRTRGGAR